MYAIREAHGSEWWNGTRWTPASNEAMEFDTRKEAMDHAEQFVNRMCVIVQID